RFELKRLVEVDRLPEYHLEWIAETESGEAAVHAVRREFLDPTHPAFKFPSRKDKRRPRIEELIPLPMDKVKIAVG
ncbi:MAG: hypothetical protein HQL40_08545, partial [Alphaproteobacteria bacterium]|nr:hypothetical protein [Alphaproteobacteria bacterium]